MVLFHGHEPILDHASGLRGDGGLRLQVKGLGLDDGARAIKKMKNKLKSRVSGEMNAIILKNWSREAWHQKNCIRAARKDFGELRQDLREAVSVPQGLGPVHRRTDKAAQLGPLAAERLHLSQEVDENRLNPQGHGRGTLASSQEIGDAREDDHVGLLPDLLERLGQDLETAARERLGTGHQRPVTTVHRVEMPLDVLITNHSEDQRHFDSFISSLE